MARSVLLAVNPHKPGTTEAAERVRKAVDRHGTVIGETDVTASCDADLAQRADLIVVLGGDGTLLAAARCFFDATAPLVGVNTGRVGFLAAFDLESMESRADDLFGGGPLSIRPVRMLSATVHSAGSDPKPIHALNEFVITAGPPFRMIQLRVRIDGELGPAVRGDGLIFSSPSGSTAYNVSAGGPILAPDIPSVVLTPIAAHSLAFRPIVLPAGVRVGVEITSGNDGGDAGTTLVADGRVERRVRTGDIVTLTGDGPTARFVEDPTRTFWRTLMDKMHWAAPPKGRDGARTARSQMP